MSLWRRASPRRTALLGAVLIVVLAATVMFGIRTVHQLRRLQIRADEPIRRWMPLDYVAHSYDVPPHILFQALDLPFPPKKRQTVGQIAKAQGRTVDEVSAILMNAIIHVRPPYPPPAPPPPPAPNE